MHRWYSVLLVAGVLVRAHPSHAAEDARSGQAAAESLFSQGRAFLLAGELEKSCEAFSASQKLDPAAGTLLNWARCLELRGLTASAWSTYASAEALAARLKQPERVAAAQKAKDRLAPFVPHVVIELEEEQKEARVELDGTILLSDVLGLPLAIDPGLHRLVVSLDSSKISREFEIGPEHSANEPLLLRLEVPRRTPTSLTTVTEAPPSTSTVEAKPAPSSPNPQPTPSSWLTPAGWTSVGVGVVITALGVGLVVDSYSRASSAACSSEGYCTDAGLATRASARESLVWGYVVGGAGLAISSVGVTLLSLSPERARVALTVRGGQHGAGLAMTGTF